MENFRLEDRIIQYNVIKSKRKTIELSINDKKEIVIKAPINCSNEYINKFLKDKQKWITERLDVIEKRLSSRVYLEFKTGERLLYLGKSYPLVVEYDKGNRIGAGFDKGEFRLVLPHYLEGEPRKEAAKKIIIDLYKKMAKSLLKERTEFYSKLIGVTVNRVFIKGQKTLWGSCSSKNNINYNWKLIMAPLEVLDYVVVHELCHIIHRNHSNAYWQEVEKYMPDYKKRIKWLKEYGFSLQLEWQPYEM
ncbi:MAG: M48 family metallopeptidase [Clostridiales bacterium]|uniref:M48 family metallopeptidase n=1 Tax=Clostridium sp. N3C TaxID=1776758 RepID=UPI00092E1D28|nr:SprT family zinc-dependent metalloprotease [Clostridium sp. N3C]NLZ47495.1 M48 family metallopeptidase [Clostridiales bacterium]SCN23048.1 hypothetical protein N3C_1087 [Clostridium sp. N3C]